MKFFETLLSGAYEIELEPFRDERGSFSRTFCKNEFQQINFNNNIVQINHSMTRKMGTIRGMHYQLPPASETKIIRCIQGRIFDVIVDLRVGSSTFLKWYGVELSKDNKKMIFVPAGFAHGFQALTDDAELIYHHSGYYSPEHERGLRYDDPYLSIKWPLPVTCISERDRGFTLIDGNLKGINI